MGVIPNPKMAFIFPISCILALIFPILIKKNPKCKGKGSFPKSQIKSLVLEEHSCSYITFLHPIFTGHRQACSIQIKSSVLFHSI